MQSLKNIKVKNATKVAKKSDSIPYVIDSWDIQRFSYKDYDCLYNLPNIGDHRPKGFVLVHTFPIKLNSDNAVAKSLSLWVKEGLAYTIVNVGDLTAIVGEFAKVTEKQPIGQRQVIQPKEKKE